MSKIIAQEREGVKYIIPQGLGSGRFCVMGRARAAAAGRGLLPAASRHGPAGPVRPKGERGRPGQRVFLGIAALPVRAYVQRRCWVRRRRSILGWYRQRACVLGHCGAFMGIPASSPQKARIGKRRPGLSH